MKCRNLKRRDLSGDIFGVYLVIRPLEKISSKFTDILYECICTKCNKKVTMLRSVVLRSTGKTCKHNKTSPRVMLTHKTQDGRSKTRQYKKFKHVEYMHKKRKLDFEWNEQDEIILREFCNNQCLLCGMTEEDSLRINKQSLHIDHLFPLSRGGGLSYKNVLLLCRSCNTKKLNRLISDLDNETQYKINSFNKEYIEYYESLKY